MAMKTYIDQLKVEAEAANLRREEVKAKFQNADSRVLCDTPLTDQITALMASLPRHSVTALGVWMNWLCGCLGAILPNRTL